MKFTLLNIYVIEIVYAFKQNLCQL